MMRSVGPLHSCFPASRVSTFPASLGRHFSASRVSTFPASLGRHFSASLVAVLVTMMIAGCGGHWPGVDESVVEKVAAHAGRTPRWLIPLEGDLLTFAFLCAGIVGGFALGYGYRALFAEGRSRDTAAKP